MRKHFGPTRQAFYLLCLLLASQFSVGCGKDGPAIAPVKGLVTVNGKPIEGVQVSFSIKNASRVSVGVTNEKGEFELTTLNTNDGAFAGENLVAIQQMSKDTASVVPGMDPEAMKLGKTDFKGPEQSMEKSNKAKSQNATIPPMYGNPEKSGLKRTVVLGEKNEFSFDLKP